ncbi:hypothetical protein BDY24DRAFT_378180 [Mrakia frigida]|uniref:uncharacterized protein n=1 Tax=Mrakia frigida TaxID=29902 RepID=UPI003FCBF0F0
MANLGPIHHVTHHVNPTPHAPPSNLIHPPSSGLISSSTSFVQAHKKALLVGAGAVAVAAAGYYYYTTTAGPGAKGGPEIDLESGKPVGGAGASTSGSSKRRKKKSAKKGVNDPDGPLLEEVKPKKEKTAVAAEEEVKNGGVEEEQKVEKKDDIPSPSASEIDAMSAEDRTALANLLKSRGNTLFSKKDFASAIDFYTRAIAVSPVESAVFYSNRAASYNSLAPPQHEKVIEDCDSALRLDTTYLKALRRRAAALEALDRDEEAVRDYTACTLLEALDPPKRSATAKDPQTGDTLESVLKKMATREAQDILRTRPAQLPSSTFITAYLDAFRPHPAPALPEPSTQADSTLILAFEALEAGDHKHAFTLAQEALTQGITWTEGKAEALNLRGTFKFLINDREGAKEDFEESIAIMPSLVQSRVKLASVHMELNNIADTFGDFEAAIAQNPLDPDIYYHRGQVYFIAGELDKAMDDYSKSSELDPEFIFSHIQRAVTQFRLEKIPLAMSSFRNILKQFPDRSEGYNYYGELLLAEQRFSDAIEKFDKAIEIEEAKPSRHKNVLPMVNKGNCLLRWKEDFAEVEPLIRKALEIDPECDIAIVTLAQISLQQSKIDQAIEMFQKAKLIGRTEEELVQAITFEQASKAQLLFTKNYPVIHARMTAMMQAQQGR